MEWDATNNKVIYKLQEIGWYYNANELQPYKEEDMKTITIDDFKANTKEWLIDKLGNMSMEDALQTISNIYNELHKPQYPKTYEECCKIMQSDPNFYIDTHLYSDKLDSLYKLLICRNAYWKIAGKEMGLDKSWEPNWTTFEGMPAIFRFRYNIVCDSIKNQHCLLVFPTEEMRDAYKENFDNDIEICKEFL